MPTPGSDYQPDAAPAAGPYDQEAASQLFADAYAGERRAGGNRPSGSRGGAELDFSPGGSRETKGDRSESITKREPVVERDSAGRPTEISSPLGSRSDAEYDADGKLTRLTVTPASGRPTFYERTKEGWWKVNGAIDYDLKQIRVADDGTIHIDHGREGSTTMRPDGSMESRDIHNRPVRQVDKAGTEKVYEYRDNSFSTLGSRMLERKSGSQMATITNPPLPFSYGYEFTHRDGHKERLEKHLDYWELSVGRKSERFPSGSKLETTPEGERMITRPDGSSFQGRADGTTIRRDSNGRITESTAPDGVTTRFERNERGGVTRIEVKSSTGKLVEEITADPPGFRSSLVGDKEEPVSYRDIRVDDKTGKYTLIQHDCRLEREANGLQDLKHWSGRSIDTYDDKVTSWMKRARLPLTSEQEVQLRADLAQIEKLAPVERASILVSLDRIIHGNADGKTEISAQQRADLVLSLTRQIAQPQSIRQGAKHAGVMASAEQAMAAAQPHRYAAMVAALAIDGRYKAADGTTVTPQLTRYGALEGSSDPYGGRSYASELFQNAAASIVLDKEGKSYRSRMPGAPLDGNRNGRMPEDTGERVIDREGRSSSFEGLTTDQRSILIRSLGLEDVCPTVRPANSAELLEAWKAAGGNGSFLQVEIGVDPKSYDFTRLWERHPEVNRECHVISITHIDTSTNPPLVYFDDPTGLGAHSYPGGRPVLLYELVYANRRAR